MVVEHLFSSKRIERHPWLVAIMAFLFVAIAVSITRLVYFQGPPKQDSLYGIFIIALAIMPAIPFFLHEIIMEEKRQEFRCQRGSLFTLGGILGFFTCYQRLIRFYGYFFIGTALGFAFCAAILPLDVSNAMFSVQNQEFRFFTLSSSQVTAQGNGLSFEDIFYHNLQVLFLLIVFSFIYSIGSIFLLVWNASLVGIFLHSYIRETIPHYIQYGALGFPASFLFGSFNGLMRLLPHGIFEISAFFIASISGGILSVAVERRMYKKSNLKEIALDVVFFLLVSVGLLGIGAWIESSYIPK